MDSVDSVALCSVCLPRDPRNNTETQKVFAERAYRGDGSLLADAGGGREGHKKTSSVDSGGQLVAVMLTVKEQPPRYESGKDAEEIR